LEFKLAQASLKSALNLIKSDTTLTKECQEIRQLISGLSKKLTKQQKSEKTMWTKAFKKQEEQPELVSSSPVSSQDGTNSSPGGVKDEEEIDLSEFGIAKPPSPNKKTKNNKKNNQQLVSPSTQYFLLSMFSLGIIGAFVAFGGRFRNFRWRF
jgi:hypothetical protein